MTIQNVIGGFRTTGVYPFDRSSLSLPEKSNRASLAERTGLGFVPLYSPSHQRQHSRVSVVLSLLKRLQHIRGDLRKGMISLMRNTRNGYLCTILKLYISEMMWFKKVRGGSMRLNYTV